MAYNFLYVDQVADYFRKIVDESDNTFLSDTDIAQYLEIGYDQFRYYVSDIDPQQYHEVYLTPAAVTTNELDLDNILLGPLVPAANKRLQQIIRVTTYSAGNSPPIGNILEPVYSYESLIGMGYYSFPNKYMLQGRKLLFAGIPSNQLRIEYIPQSTVDWTKQTSGDNEFIDDLIQYHDVIALMAARQYQMVDGATSVEIERQIAIRQSNLTDFLTRGRLVPANRFVQNDSPYSL